MEMHANTEEPLIGPQGSRLLGVRLRPGVGRLQYFSFLFAGFAASMLRLTVGLLFVILLGD